MSRVKLTSVPALTFYKGSFTQSRRTSPIPQLVCLGKACRYYTPDVVRCENLGGEGAEIDWKCEADLPEALRFGRVEVSCEGWSGPGDPYVLKGSCGLEYRLNEVPNLLRDRSSQTANGSVFMIVWVAVLIFIIFGFLKSCLARNTTSRTRNTPPTSGARPGGSGWFPGGYGDETSAPPPPYSKPQSGSNEAWGPGFWTGAAVGGLGTALWNNRRSSRTEPEAARWDWERPVVREFFTGRRASPSFEDRGEGSSNLGSMRPSTGLGGTNVR
jgi:hypothetical protein